jgi:hypothetical protein
VYLYKDYKYGLWKYQDRRRRYTLEEERERKGK